MNGERRSIDGFFGVASPTGSSRARPQSAGTRLRQKPAAPTHEDLFATLGIDPHTAADASARSSLFSNRGSNASVSSASGLSNASLHQYGVPSRGFAGQPPPPAPTLASATNWGGSTSRFAAPGAQAAVTRATPPVATASRFGPPPTTFGAHASAFTASTTGPAPPAPGAKSSSASLFSMEDSDAFEMDDGWGLDSPSAVLSPSGALSNPSKAAAEAVAESDAAADDFGWDDAGTDRQFGLTPPKPAPSPSPPSAAPLFPSHAPPTARAPLPAASPPPLPTATAASPFAFHQPTARATTPQGFQQGTSAAATSSVSLSFSTPSASPPPVVTQASELAYVEHHSWDESWDDAEAVPDHKRSPAADVHAAPGASSTALLSVPVPESMSVENEFWGDHDDDALFDDDDDDDDHANDKWDASPAVQKTRDDMAAMPLCDTEAASTGEIADGAGDQYEQRGDGEEGASGTSSAPKGWEDVQHGPESHEERDAHWRSAAASPSKEAHFGNTYFQHGETVASVHFATSGVESENAHFGGQGQSAFRYDENASRDEAQFYASVRNHEGGSTASIGGDVSSAGATFGGSDYVRSDTFSDGTFSETRSIFGSSNASTAFGTDFPSVSEGFSAAATTFGGSDYVSDGQYSDGNVSESPSLNGSLHPSVETNSELPRHAGEEEQFFGEDNDDENPFEMSGNSGSTFDDAYPSTPSVGGLFDQDSGASEAANPFASSPSVSFAASASEPSFQATPFGASASASTADAATASVQSAASLFGATVGSDVANPFGEQPTPSFAEKELDVADAGDLFASSPTAAAFGGGGGSSFNEPSQHYSEQSYQSYDQGYHQQHAQGFDQTGFEQSHGEFNASAHFGHGAAASADELFGQSDGAFNGFRSDSSPFGQQAASTADALTGYAQQADTAHGGGAAYPSFAHGGQHANESYYATQDRGGAESAYASHGEQSSPADYFQDRSHSGVPPSAAPVATSVFASSSAAPSRGEQNETRSEFHGSQSFGATSATASSGFSQHQHSYARTETSTSSAETAFAEGSREHTHEFSQADSFASSGFSDGGFGLQSNASAQDFFGDASGASSSFASSNEFFGGDSSSYQPQEQQEQAQPGLARGLSDASALSDRHFASDNMSGYEQHPRLEQQQSWSQEHAFAQSEVRGGSFEASTHEAAGAPAHNDAGEPSREIHEHASVSEAAPVNEHASPFGHGGAAERSSFAPEHSAAASDGSQQQSQYESTYQHGGGQFGFAAEPVGPPPTTFAPALPQHDEDAASVFGTSSQAGDGFRMGDQFAGQEPFSAPPPAGQDPSATSYFGEQPSAAQAYGGDEFNAVSSEYFAAPVQHGGGYGAQPQSFEQAAHDGYGQFAATGYEAAETSYQHQQQQHHQQEHQYHEHQQHSEPFGHTGRGFSEFATAHQAPPNANNYAAHGAPTGHAAQSSSYYGQTGAGGDAAVSSYAPEYSAATQGYNAAAAAGYGGTHTQAPPAMRSSKYKDPSVPAPSCLASFGFGGNVVTMFPKRKLRLNMAGGSFRNSPRAPVPSYPDNTELGELRKGPVGLYKMDQIHPKDRHFEQFESFPGPLTENVSEDVVLHYLDEHLKNDGGALSSQQEDERLLAGILKILVKCNGKLRSDPTGNPSDPDSPEVQLVTLLRESDYRRRGNQAPVFPPPKLAQTGLHPDAVAKHATSIRDLLLVGDRNAAVDVAVRAQMWPEAMLIASFTGKDEYKRVLRTYLEGHYAVGDPCRALYMSFADQQEKSVQEPSKLLHAPHQEPEPPSSLILASWVTHAQVILANRTGDTNKILLELGDRLWKETGSILAAHACYLSAGIPVEAPSPSSKIALLGADHRTPKEARFYVSAAAVQRTEIYEWVQKRSSGSGATSMIPFQGYKLIYAMLLADHGKLETSFKYVSAMLSVIKAVVATMKPGTSMYLEGMQNQLTVLDDRLRQHLGQHRVNSVASASSNKQGKWGFGSALSMMGKIVNRVVEGSDGSGAPSAAQTGAPQDGGSSLFPGAPRASAVPASPAYASGPTQTHASYAQQQQQQQQHLGQAAPLSNDARSATPQRAPSPAYPGYSQQVPSTSLYGAPVSNDSATTHQQQQFHRAPTPTTPAFPGYGQQGGVQSGPYSNDSSSAHQQQQFHRALTPTPPAFPRYGQQNVQSAPYSNEPTAAPSYPSTLSQSFQGYGQHNAQATPRSSEPIAAPSYPSTPSQSFQGYGQHNAQATPRSSEPTATPSYPSTPSQSFQGYGQPAAPYADAYGAAPGSNNGSAAGFQQPPAFQGYGPPPAAPQPNESSGAPSSSSLQPPYPAYGKQPTPRSNDSTAISGYQCDPLQAYSGYGQSGGTPAQTYAGYAPPGASSAPRSNDSNASRGGYARDPSQAYPGYNGHQGGGGNATPATGGFGTPQFGPSSTPSHGAATPSGAFASHGNSPQMQFAQPPPGSQDSRGPAPHQRSTTAPPPTSESTGPSSSQGGFFSPQAPSQPQPRAVPPAFHHVSQPHVSNSAPPSMPASPSTFTKPTLDLSGDAGKGVAVPPRRPAELPAGGAGGNTLVAEGGAAPPSSGPSSDKGSASPKFKDAAKKAGGRSKTPPPSGSKSGWLSGVIGNFLVKKMNPEVKVAKLGEQMEAYFDEEKKRWVFPGETAAEEPTMPSAPPLGPSMGSGSAGPPGPPGSTHSAPGSIGGGGAGDPLAALMAPPPARAHAAMMKKDPLSAMMAPPTRSMPGMRGASAGAQRKPPRPQFAVFKPAPQAPHAPEAAEE
ncbi:hypothetical protein PybrP1_002822 [[Pythium] brassicae (nom. inval.)]|nr:hypothetical protein PybrP1_002822 [[Pythium] brassicae (nom. inval.)]